MQGLPYNAQQSRFRAESIRVVEAKRLFGGALTNAAFNNLNRVLNQEAYVAQTQAIAEDLRAVAIPAPFEMDQRNRELARGFSRITNAENLQDGRTDRDEDLQDRRTDRDLEESGRSRVWGGMNNLARAHTHLARGAVAVGQATKIIDQAQEQEGSRAALMNLTGRTVLRLITGRVEIQHMDNPLLGGNPQPKSNTVLFPSDKISEKI